MKKCKLCHIIKPLSLFPKHKGMIDGYKNQCKPCVKERNKVRNATIKTKERNRYNNAIRYADPIKRQIEKDRKKIYRAKPKTKAKQRIYNIQYNIKHKNKRKIDPLYRAIDNLKSIVSKSIKRAGWTKESKSQVYLGSNWITVYNHLCRTFVLNYNMNWDDKYLNYLHIDHVIPISSAQSLEEAIKLSHYSNLQYLWKIHNFEKKASLTWTLTEAHIKEFQVFARSS